MQRHGRSAASRELLSLVGCDRMSWSWFWTRRVGGVTDGLDRDLGRRRERDVSNELPEKRSDRYERPLGGHDRDATDAQHRAVRSEVRGLELDAGPVGG